MECPNSAVEIAGRSYEMNSKDNAMTVISG
jgi:hypothetical protein